MADQPFLEGQKSHQRLKDMKIYVIQFPNFEDPKNKDLDDPITLREARKKFFKVFKTSRKIQRPTEQEMKEISQKGNKDALAVPDAVKEHVAWLFGPEANETTISKREFLKCVISAVLFTIKYELNLHYSLLESRDKDEIFCEIWASERWLTTKAQAVDYRLQFRPSPEDITEAALAKYPFKAVPPYAIFELPSIFADKRDAKKLFKHFDDDEKETDTKGSLFTYNDRVRLIRNSLNTRLDLHIMKEYEISIEDFCLHSEKPLTALKNDWANFGQLFSAQPLTQIRDYFGEKVALYFSWMEMYKNFMISAGVIGLIVQILLFLRYFDVLEDSRYSQGGQVLFALFLAFWASFFDQIWARKQKILAWRWGTTEFYEEEEQRGEFRGVMQRDPVTGKMKRKRPHETFDRIKNVISYGIVLLVVVSVLVIIWAIMFMRWTLKEVISSYGLIAAGAANAIQIRVFNLLYDRLAILLNDWENHETETIYNDKLAVKVFIFRFFNSYSSLFYLAYYCEEVREGEGHGSCMDFLGIQLAVIFFISILLNVIEILVPYLLMKRRLIAEDMKMNDMKEKDPTLRTNMLPVEKDAKKESYETPLFDYIEMIIEFGYVALFGTALPILPLLLLIEIIFEIRVDAWKLCNLMKRADPHRSEDIGVFKDIIVIMAYAGATNNTGLIVFTSGAIQNFFSYTEVVAGVETLVVPSLSVTLMVFIALEHFMLIGMFLISVAIPDEPDFVIKGLAWGERIVNEKLYMAGNSYKVNMAKNLIDGAVHEIKKVFGFDDFKLKAEDIPYRENH